VDSHAPGDKALFTDSNLSYNSSSNYLNANVPYANSAGSATNATYASSAANATSAGSATNATYATSAGSATNATYAGSAAYATSAGSTGVLTGYQFYDNGRGYARIGSQGANKFLINWGASASIAVNSSAYQTFRAAFGAVYAIVSTRIEAGTAASYAWSHGQVSTSGFRIYSNGARAGQWYWIAVGR
jgi:hypothetical protein